MTLAYDLCAYDRTNALLAREYPVPAQLLPMVRTLIEPVADDHDLVLPYELTPAAAATLANAMGLTLDGAAYRYYFEASAACADAAEPGDAIAAHRAA